ncbi:MAG: hypothetical protein WC768_01875 [Patescibacteria group bacterium]|jgi:hypothetical protein
MSLYLFSLIFGGCRGSNPFKGCAVITAASEEAAWEVLGKTRNKGVADAKADYWLEFSCPIGDGEARLVAFIDRLGQVGCQ